MIRPCAIFYKILCLFVIRFLSLLRTMFPKPGDIIPLGALDLSKETMEVTHLIWGYFITKRGR